LKQLSESSAQLQSAIEQVINEFINEMLLAINALLTSEYGVKQCLINLSNHFRIGAHPSSQ
jgi:hypothetical protein